ncbi:pilus assembly protein PilP [Vibrio sp. SM6]|uniref:Pilus assembly protein PilP n=1 Tax=Vibrio agarilyticus TaxID=2726741 RepID=A0A7X8YHH1_9VIBR|nr:pilus assembly protein PilP [Vibrio agarilyticus]NLS13481.1 pilus assembly protein PilP [Vibrio agarilyticus]
MSDPNERRTMKLVILSVVAGALMGCRAEQAPLDQFVRETETQARQYIAALAPESSSNISTYVALSDHDPFALPLAAHKVSPATSTEQACWQPPTRQTKVKFERFPLEQLMFKGVMSNGKSSLGVISAPDGAVAAVRAGDILGMNFGQITKIDANTITVTEMLADGLGCWQSRQQTLALYSGEQNAK